MRKDYIKAIIKILWQIKDYNRLAKIYAVAQTHLELQEKEGA